MQTFLPEPSFEKSAKCLDYRRLGKQRVEVKQLLLALGHQVGPHLPKSSSWSNHPAARMWKGYEPMLISYGVQICKEWRARGYQDTLLPQFEELQTGISFAPTWFGDTKFHRSHQSNLIRKDWDHYAKFWPDVPDNLEYVWPV